LHIRRLLSLGVPTLAKLRCQPSPQDQFEQIVRKCIRPYHIVLDAGCGRRANIELKGNCRMLVGTDIDAQIAENTGIDAAVRADLGKLPFRDKTFDIVISWWVIEHLDAPQNCFREFARVCKDEAIVIHGTPNILHYAMLFAASTPFWFHDWFRRFILGDKHGSYPTKYKANTPKRMESMMKEAGFTSVEVHCIDSGPGYFRWFTPLYAIGLIYHRLVSCLNVFASFRDSIIGIFCRQASPREWDRGNQGTHARMSG
jgi:ubiquinone/menaquinone biosynthesis C-methylase UbiE